MMKSGFINAASIMIKKRVVTLCKIHKVYTLFAEQKVVPAACPARGGNVSAVNLAYLALNRYGQAKQRRKTMDKITYALESFKNIQDLINLLTKNQVQYLLLLGWFLQHLFNS
jgi:hypothetical protein